MNKTNTMSSYAQEIDNIMYCVDELFNGKIRYSLDKNGNVKYVEHYIRFLYDDDEDKYNWKLDTKINNLFLKYDIIPVYKRIKATIEMAPHILNCEKSKIKSKFFELCNFTDEIIERAGGDDVYLEYSYGTNDKYLIEIIKDRIMIEVLNKLTKREIVRLEQMKKKMILIKSHKIPKDLIRYNISNFL